MVCAIGLLVLALASQIPDYPPYAVPRLEGTPIPGLPPITGRIAVDQFGYLPGESKVAVISDPQKGYNAADAYAPGPTMEVCERATKKAVLTGQPKPWKNGATDESSGDKGWWFDFSAVQKPGEYFVFDPKTGMRSAIFEIKDSVFAPILKAATRMFFYQRLSFDLKEPYAEKPWTQEAAYNQDKKARFVNAKNDAGQERDLSGGWMDAGDTDKYPPFNAEVIAPLLYAYRANPKAFGDNFGIPESGNGLPDLLDEVKFQLDWLIRMQFPDGGVPIKMGHIDYAGKQPISADDRVRYYGPKDTGAAITVSGIFANAARLYSQFPAWKTYAADLQRRAVLSWDYYQSHPKTTNLDTGEIKAGIANRSVEDQEQLECIAGVHLFALTGQAKYHDAAKAKAGKLRQLSETTWSPYGAAAAEALVDYLSFPNAHPALAKRIKDQLKKSAESDNWAPAADKDLYRAWITPTSYHWGSSSVRANWGLVSLLAAKAADLDAETKRRLRDRAAGLLHSFHGVNPLTLVYLSNMGKYGAEQSCKYLYHDRWGAASPHSGNPAPGYVVGGPNQSFGGKAADGAPSVEWIKSQPRGKAYADFDKAWPEASWELSEPAIYYQAMYVRLLSEFVGKGS